MPTMPISTMSTPITSNKERKKDSVESADSETETESLARTSPSVVATGSTTSARLQPFDQDPKKRVSTGGDSSGYGSTDSEWEKVEES